MQLLLPHGGLYQVFKHKASERLALETQAVKEYFKTHFKEFLADSVFIESISGHMEFGSENKKRVQKNIDFLKAYAKSNKDK